jgi:hypothetical protein
VFDHPEQTRFPKLSPEESTSFRSFANEGKGKGLVCETTLKNEDNEHNEWYAKIKGSEVKKTG